MDLVFYYRPALEEREPTTLLGRVESDWHWLPVPSRALEPAPWLSMTPDYF